MKNVITFLIVLLVVSSGAFAQRLYFPQRAVSDTQALSMAMPVFAQNVMLRNNNSKDRKEHLSNLFILQMITGKYSLALASIDSIRSLNKASGTKYPELTFIQYEIYCRAKISADSGGINFDEAFKKYFNGFNKKLNDKEALYVSTAFMSRNGIEDIYLHLQQSLVRVQDDSLSLDDAMALCRNYNLYEVFKIIEPLASPLRMEDRSTRFIIEDSVMIKTRDGAYISARVARKRGNLHPQSAILQFTIYASHYPYGSTMLLDPVVNSSPDSPLTRRSGSSPLPLLPSPIGEGMGVGPRFSLRNFHEAVNFYYYLRVETKNITVAA